jgi:hypothetical protein
VVLEKGFFVKDSTRDEFTKVRGSEKKTSVSLTSFFSVFNTN